MSYSRKVEQEKPSQPNSSPQETNLYEDEIDLRAYLDVIIARKKLIIGVFLTCTILATVVSCLLPKVYEANASIMVMPSRIQSVLTPSQISLDLDSASQSRGMAQRPTMSLSTHKTLLKSNAVLQRLINKLTSSGKMSKKITPDELTRRTDIVDTEKTGILQLVVRGKNPSEVTYIANTWAEEYAKYSMELIRGEIRGSGDFIVEQFKQTQENLAKAEQNLNNFDTEERLGLMQIELTEDQNQLDAHYAKAVKLEFTLGQKKNLLEKIDSDIAAMTSNGVWLGTVGSAAFEQKRSAQETLSDEQKILRQKVIEAVRALENARNECDRFTNESGILSIRDEVVKRREDLLTDKLVLAQVEQLCEATKVNLKSQGAPNMLKTLQGPIAENLPDLTIWEILSLAQGYNFFETRKQTLAAKITRQETELKELEKTALEYDDRLKTLNENVSAAQLNYDFYFNQLKSLKSEKNSIETEMANIDLELAYSRQMAKKLEDEVKTLKVAINEKKAKLAELNRQLQICRNAYEFLSPKVEEARIARAMEMGEVKVVSTAFQPQYPVGPKSLRNIAAAGAAGLMLGVFVALAKEYRQKKQSDQTT